MIAYDISKPYPVDLRDFPEILEKIKDSKCCRCDQEFSPTKPILFVETGDSVRWWHHVSFIKETCHFPKMTRQPHE